MSNCGKVFLLACISLLLNINVFAQRINLRANNITVKDAIEQLKKSTGVSFYFSPNDLDTKKIISISLKDATINEAVQQLIQGQASLVYEIKDKSVVIKKSADREFSQGKSGFEGRVLDSNGDPVVGAAVIESGTNNATTTDAEGNFKINLESNAMLEISCIGFEDERVQAIPGKPIVVLLQIDTQTLDEIVVVGYGIQKKVNLTGAISTVDMADIENRPITNATQILQGTQGVYVNQAGGQPGVDGATIRIRGQGTLNNNNPLVLVDGIEFPLDAINPNDIESISVLKDAASSAIYGSRAANGVILVTTKKGKEGSFNVDYNNYFGFQQAGYLPDFVYDPIVFMESRNQAQRNEGKLTVDYSDDLIAEYKEGMKKDPITYPCNNWLDIMFNNAFIMEHNLRFSGGSSRYTYSLSLGYGNQDGVLRGTDSKKYTIAINTSAKLNDRLKVGANVNANYLIYNEPVSGVANLIEMTYKAQAFHPTYTSDGRYADTFIRTPGHNIYRHPLALADEGENRHKNLRILTNLSLDYALPFDIQYKLNVGINKLDNIQTRFAPEVYEYQLKTNAKKKIVFDGQNTRNEYNGDRNDLSITVYNTLSWEKKFFENHDVKLLAGFSYEEDDEHIFSAKIEGFLGNELHEIDAGSSNPAVTGTSSKSVLMSYFGRLNYSFKDRYLFEGNFRYDGSSRFAKHNRWGLFPSFSAGWRLSEEHFMKRFEWLENLKIRASWGQLGNERIELFRYVDLMDLSKSYPLNGEINSGAAVTAYNDPDITWETTTMANLGVDASFLNGKLDFSFELFDKRTSDILRKVTLPAQVGGLDGPIRNIGEVSNKGFEVNLGYRESIKDFFYGVNGNMTYVRNRIESLKGQTIIDGMFILKEGEPIDSYYMLHSIGIFQSEEEIKNSPFQTAATKPGYLKFEDIKKDNKITEEDRKICGGVIPKITYAFNIDLGWKNLSLNAFFQGVHGVKTYGDRIGATPLWFGCGLPKKWLTDSWTPERGTKAGLPILTTYEGCLNENFRTNDFWLRDASYLRLKNLQLTYSFPESLVKKIKIKKLKVFVNAQNMFTFSHMKDFDPEKNLKGSTWYAYPTVKTYTAGINVIF